MATTKSDKDRAIARLERAALRYAYEGRKPATAENMKALDRARVALHRAALDLAREMLCREAAR